MEINDYVIFHFHIFKNGGTTIEWILKKNFSKNAISIDTDKPDGILSNKQIIEKIRKNPKTRSISSHQIRFPVPDETFCIPIVFLREPIDRAFSIYYFQKRRKDSRRPGIIMAKKLSLNDYIKWNFSLKKFMIMKNFQVLYLSKEDVDTDVNCDDFQLARERMRKCRIIGIVDRFDESLVVAENSLKNKFQDIDLSYIKQNYSTDRHENLEKRIKTESDKLNPKILEELKQRNEFDLRLYEFANMELDKRIRECDNFQSKLADFKLRCKTLQ